MERYEAYKDSGVEWIGEIPASWSVHRVKDSCAVVAGATPKSDISEYWDGNIPWITPADYSETQRYVSGGSRSITELGLNSCGTTLVPKGSVIVSNRAPIGLVSVASCPLSTNQGCKAIVPLNDSVLSEYLYWYLLTQTGALNSLGRGTTFLELSTQALSTFVYPSPSLKEQQAIADYLDAKTAEIDALVADCEREVGLLREYRKAVISEAVTKGLDPDAPMKDSGIEWIGEIPKGWGIKRVKQVTELRTGKTPTTSRPDFFDGDVPWFAPGDLLGFEAEEPERYVSALAVESGAVDMVPAGSVLFVGVGYSSGKSAFATIDCCTNQQITALMPCGIGGRYLAYLMSVLGDEILKLATFNRVPLVNNEFIGNLRIPAPESDEQNAIVAELNAKTAEIDSLIEAKQTMVDKLREYRKSLISEAVTGKFKVRVA